MTQPVLWTDLGRMAYAPAWQLQQALVAERKRNPDRVPDRLLLVEHDPVITVGRRAEVGTSHILATPEVLASRGIEVFAVERGGDVTYHGPGQLVLYPLLDLARYKKDVRWYATSLMEVVARAIREFGIEAEVRTGPTTGVWVAGPTRTGADDLSHEQLSPGKIAALGIRIERWLTYHGVALNVSTRLEDFDLIVPCGLTGARVVSMESQLGHALGMDDVKSAMLRAFASVFEVSLEPARALNLPA